MTFGISSISFDPTRPTVHSMWLKRHLSLLAHPLVPALARIAGLGTNFNYTNNSVSV